jgi:hypothetical protein
VRPLAPSPAWTLVTPYCKRTRPGRGTNTKATGFPPLSRPSPATSLPPFALGLVPTHLGWGTRRHFTRRPRDPRSRNADNILAYLIMKDLGCHFAEASSSILEPLRHPKVTISTTGSYEACFGSSSFFIQIW